MASTSLLITRRGLRVVHTLAAFAAALLTLAVAGLAGGEDGADDEWASLPPAEGLAAAPCPAPQSIELAVADADELEAVRRGSFEVFGPEPTRLEPPIDWHHDPLAAHAYRQNLHKLRFLGPLLSGYRDAGERADLEQALAIALDWVDQNRRGAAGTPIEAWADKIVGDRIPYLAYLLRAAACEGASSERQRGELLDALVEHGRVLSSREIYVPDNHGLFVDLGLVRLVNFLPFLEQGEEWRALARKRFERTLRGRLADGFWLEHSSAYQFLVIRALERMLAVYGDDAALAATLAEMRSAAAWFVRPDGEMTQFGDSDQEPVPEWVGEPEAGLRAALDAGFAFVRAAGPDGVPGYLAVTAGFHNTTHKHADALSFELFDRGAGIVTDTGLYDKDPGPVRDFVVSNRAHSTLVVDGQDLPVDDEGAAYGSGLLAAGEGEGWYAIEGRNPQLAAQDVAHRRLFLYRPGEALVIVDRVESPLPHTYARYLHLGPDVEIDPAGEGVGITAGDLDGSIFDLADISVTRSQARGQEAPMQGFTSPRFRKLVPRWTISYSAAGSTETFATTIALTEAMLRATAVESRGATTVVELEDADGGGQQVEIVREGDGLAVEAG